jgi:hypothetical protein
MSTKKLIHFDLRTIEEHTGCTPWMLSTPYLVKLLSSVLWTESFRNSRKCSKPWSTSKTFISAKILLGTNTYYISSWNWTNTVSATQGCDSKWIQGLIMHCENQWIPNWTREVTHTHTQTHTYTHTKCRYTVHNRVSKFLTNTYWITRLNTREVTEPKDTLVHSINSHNPNERLSFKDSYAYLNSG